MDGRWRAKGYQRRQGYIGKRQVHRGQANLCSLEAVIVPVVDVSKDTVLVFESSVASDGCLGWVSRRRETSAEEDREGR